MINTFSTKVTPYITEGTIIAVNTAQKAVATLPKATRHPYSSPYAIIKNVVPNNNKSIESYVVSHGNPIDDNKTIAIV